MSENSSKPMTATQINAIQEEALGLMRELNEYAQKHYRSQPRCTCDLMSICTRLYSALIKRLGSSSDETSERCHFRAFGRFPCEKPKGHDGDHTCQLPADHRAGTEPLSRIIADLEMAISPDLSRSVADRFMIVEEVLRQLRSAEKAPETADDSDFCDCGDYPNGPLRRKADCPRHSSKNGEGG